MKNPKWMNVDVPQPPDRDGPAILLYDIETSPQLGYTWGNYKANVIRVVKPWYVLSVAYRWVGDDTTHFTAIWHDPAFVPDRGWTKPRPNVDRHVLARMWHLFDRADVLVAHNGDKFDQRKINARIITAGMVPPSPSSSIDTLKEARRYFGFTSNRLDDLARHMGFGSKVGHSGMDTWFGAMAGDPDQQERMERYNRGDIDLLAELYDRLLPWIGSPGKALPGANYGMWNTGRPVCPKCGGDVTARGYYRSRVRDYKRWQCKSCHGYSRSRLSERQYDGGTSLV